MKINQYEFGEIEGQTVALYELLNDNGMVVKLSTYGATVTSLAIPEGDKKIELACGFDTLDGYLSDDYKANAPYFGCTVGRYASRIKDGKFSVEGKEYATVTNDGSNHLHGGAIGFDKRIWTAQTEQTDDAATVVMSLVSEDMEEGYPGTAEVSVRFSLTNKNQLDISYKGVVSKATPLSMTNHTYFNLSGFKNTIEGHKATILSDTLMTPDDTNVPVGNTHKTEGFDDLQEGKLLADAFKEMETGYEHFYVIKNEGTMRKVAAFEDTDSGRTLEVETDESGMLFYTGYFTSDKLARENGDQFGKYRGFCCETSRWANGPNIPEAPDAITTPEKPFTSRTIYTLNW